MSFEELRRNIRTEEFDYQTLMSYLTEYANPRNVIRRLLHGQKIIRVKKGFYVFGADYRKGLICKEVLANQIYGPSYISFESALSFHGMIPERVETLTSATTGKTRIFDTPLGRFSYQHLPLSKYTVGMIIKQMDEHHRILIATPEKALIDLIYVYKGLSNQKNWEAILEEDFRIESDALRALSFEQLSLLANLFAHRRIHQLVQFIQKNYA
ncbi:MAG: hypothetical protein KGI80_00950 [Verrucomicrobiota bacterium]|nr:hypothetical protein [Verrucomicrobiota bacterium]